MTSDDTDDLRAFLRDHVSSFEELETLLFFVRAPHQVWSITEIAASVHLSEEAAEGALDGLTSALDSLERTSAVGQVRAYRFTPPEDTLRLLENLRRAYADDRLSILQIMTANAMDRVRSAAARRLADAFRLDRRKK